MDLTQQLYRKSVFFLAVLPLLAAWGFWVTFLVQPTGNFSAWHHLHGAAMLGWMLLLIGQAFLIRTARGPGHRVLGKVSYVWAPFVLLSTIALANHALEKRGLTPEGRYLLALQLFMLMQFAVCYALAIRHRHQRDRHARFMVCTALPLLDPIIARILLVNFMPVEIQSGIAQLITFGLTDAILLALIAWDWSENRRVDVFLPLLPFFLLTQIPVFFVVDWPAWTAFAGWFMALPLS